MFRFAQLIVVLILAVITLGSTKSEAQNIQPHYNMRPWVLGGYVINPNNNVAYKYYLTIYQGWIYGIDRDLPIQNGQLVINDQQSGQRITENNPLILDEKDFGGKVVLFPGLINMHGHMKYDILPMWNMARSQFSNRYQWRTWSEYKSYAVSLNMKALRQSNTESSSAYPKEQKQLNECAAARWSELTALTSGTTAMQGIAPNGKCGRFWGTKNVEHAEDWYDNRRVRATFEVLAPEFYEPMTTNYILPRIQQGLGHYWNVIQELLGMAANGGTVSLGREDIPDNKADRYVNWFEAKTRQSVWGFMNQDIPSGAGRAFITHLAEGSRRDGYNRIEYPWARFLGYVKPGLNIIHGVGMDAGDFAHAAQTGVSIVWSPMSNLLLYGETLDVVSAMSAGVNISMGTDWSPTGSKHMLDELKIARRYLNAFEPQGQMITDKHLVDMATINAARGLGLQNTAGQIGYGKLADLVAIKVDDTSNRRGALYSKLVWSTQKDVALTVVHGMPVYGELSAMKEVGQMWDGGHRRLEAVPRNPRQHRDNRAFNNTCGKLAGTKAFRLAYQAEPDLVFAGSGIGSVYGIDQILSVALGTFREGAMATGKPRQVQALADGLDPMYNCEDFDYQARVHTFVEQEVPANLQAAQAMEWKYQSLKSLPADYNYERDRQLMMSVAE